MLQDKSISRGFAAALVSLLTITTLSFFGFATSPAHAQNKAEENKNQSSWFKLCFKSNVPDLKKPDAKPEEKQICLTQYESFNPRSGSVLVAAAIRQIEGQKQQKFMVIVPHGMVIPANVRVVIDDNKPIALPYTICAPSPGGCTAEIDVTPDLMKQIKTGKQMNVAALTRVGKWIRFPIPLGGFETAMNGKPMDNKKYGELMQKLQNAIIQRNLKLAEQRKQKEQQKK